MTTDVAEVTEASLEGELAILNDEIAITERQLEEVRERYQAAVDAEGQAMQAQTEAEAVYVPLLLATKQSDNQTIFGVGDTTWRLTFPEAAAAWGRVQACREVVQKAGVTRMQLHAVLRDIESRRLPGLRTAAFDKEQQLEQFRAQQARAVETRALTLEAGLAAFRKKIRGEKA